MCTLTYLPVQNGYIFTHSRDERKDRLSSKTFQKKKLNKQVLYYPEDLKAHGSWFAFSDKGISACILNGGSKPHRRKDKYRKSRGLVVIESFTYSCPQTFYEQYNFEDIEPFILIIHSGSQFTQLIHNEDNTTLHQLDSSLKYIWFSTTLYTKEIRDKRKQWFTNWLSQNSSITPASASKFHICSSDGDSENDLIISYWGILKMVSLTQVSLKKNKAELYYQDFVSSNIDHKTLILQ